MLLTHGLSYNSSLLGLTCWAIPPSGKKADRQTDGQTGMSMMMMMIAHAMLDELNADAVAAIAAAGEDGDEGGKKEKKEQLTPRSVDPEL